MSITPEQFKEIIDSIVTDRLIGIENLVRETRSDLLSAVDANNKKVDTLEIEMLSNQAAHDRYEERISRLEVATA